MDEPETNFLSAKDEMVVRAPIIGGILRTITFKTDMIKVWKMISVITRDPNCWTYSKLSQRKINGRKAYRDLWDHLLGPDHVDNMADEAQRILVATH